MTQTNVVDLQDRRIAITGAEGRMASSMRPSLRSRYGRLVLHSRLPITDLAPNESNVVGDLTDLYSVRAAFTGADSVVHLGGIADETDPMELVHSNVIGTLNAYEAARECSVKRFVYASSHHVVGFYPADETATTDSPFRPDSFYAVTKVYGEALGRLYADKHKLEVVCLRIGTFQPEPRTARHLRAWLSPADAVNLVERSLDAPGVEFVVVYGVSANTEGRWSLGEGARRIGYVPHDDASTSAVDLDRLRGTEHPADRFHGGVFTLPTYRAGSW